MAFADYSITFDWNQVMWCVCQTWKSKKDPGPFSAGLNFFFGETNSGVHIAWVHLHEQKNQKV
jgi:hypothetical protein